MRHRELHIYEHIYTGVYKLNNKKHLDFTEGDGPIVL